jgi:hypothetical protein
MQKEGFKFDLRSFVWACEARSSTFNVVTFLERLVSYKGDINYRSFRAILIDCGVEFTDSEYLALVGLLSGEDSEAGFDVIRRWIRVVRICGVRYYLYLMRIRWKWETVRVDGRIAYRVSHAAYAGQSWVSHELMKMYIQKKTTGIFRHSAPEFCVPKASPSSTSKALSLLFRR